jgi:hypothetical protein
LAVTGLLVLAACGAGGPGVDVKVSPCPTPAVDDVFEPDPSPTLCPSGSGSGQGGQNGAGGAGGGNAGGGASSGPGGGGGAGGGGGGTGGGSGGGNTVTSAWSETVTVSDAALQSTRHQDYRASVNVVFGAGGEGSWALTGTANITSAFTEELTEHLQDVTGASCTTHHSDDASASGSVPVEGGLEATDGFYNFYLNVGTIDGTNTSVRDDSACGGPNTTESNVWSAGATTLTGSGEYSGTSISGSTSEPLEGGQRTLSWSFSIPQ